MDKGICAFCDGKEASIALLTDRAYPIGLKCWDRVVDRGICWVGQVGISELRILIRKRNKRVPDANS